MAGNCETESKYSVILQSLAKCVRRNFHLHPSSHSSYCLPCAKMTLGDFCVVMYSNFRKVEAPGNLLIQFSSLSRNRGRGSSAYNTQNVCHSRSTKHGCDELTPT